MSLQPLSFISSVKTANRGTRLVARNVGVVLGMPKHECRFQGICRIEDSDLTETPAQGYKGIRVSGRLEQNSPGICRLLIPTNQLSPMQEKEHFGIPTISCYSRLAVGNILTPKARKVRYVRPGNYPISRKDNYYLITLPLAHHFPQQG